MKKVLVTTAAVLAMSLAANLVAQTESVVTVVNRSDWAIYQLYLSPTSESEWGPDQLGAEVIPANGGTFVLHGVPCDTYDVKLVDEDGDECIVGGVELCAEDQTWSINNSNLLSCQGWGE